MEPVARMRPDPAPAPPFQRIGIVGLGLIGGSIALRARRQWPSVHIAGIDKAAVLESAIARRVIDTGHKAITDLIDRDLVVLATPVSTILTQLASCASLPGLVTDVGSTKRRIMMAARDAGLRTFVGGHPMAGAAAGGLDHADAGLFDGRRWMLVEGAPGSRDAGRLHAFVTGMGARPAVVDGDTHDRTVAHVSHLPQLLALSLMSTAGEAVGDTWLSAAGPGFIGMTRLAASPFDVWQGILETNADYIAEAIRDLVAHLPQRASAVTDAAAMASAFAHANAWQARARKASER
jgi:prephenate dehydrogenase